MSVLLPVPVDGAISMDITVEYNIIECIIKVLNSTLRFFTYSIYWYNKNDIHQLIRIACSP